MNIISKSVLKINNNQEFIILNFLDTLYIYYNRNSFSRMSEFKIPE